MTAYRQYLTNAEGEPMGYEFIYPDEAPNYEAEYEAWEGEEYDPDSDPNHSHYEDMDFDTKALDIPGNVNKDCSWCNIPVLGPWDESYYED